MKLDVICGTPQEIEAALPAPERGSEAKTYLLEQLESAAASKQELVSFRSVTASEKSSDDFALFGTIERTILDFLKAHEWPKSVRIVCGDENTARLYRVVYNYWFAETKAARLNNGEWD